MTNPVNSAYLEQVAETGDIKSVRALMENLLQLQMDETVMEFGFGLGDVIASLATYLTSGEAIGIDIDPDMVSLARDRHQASNLTFKEMDLLRLDQPEASIDAVLIERTLQHLQKPLGALEIAHRILKSEGRIVIFEPDWGTLTAPADHQVTQTILNSIRIPTPHMGRHLLPLMEEAGFQSIVIVGMVGILHSLKEADAIFQLQKCAEWAVGDRSITENQADQWWRQLQEADDKPGFMASISGFVAYGEKS